MDEESPIWRPTDVHGLEVLSEGTVSVSMRLYGWEAVLPMSLIRSIGLPSEPKVSDRRDSAGVAVAAWLMPTAYRATAV
ncbi:hypothetical protein GCM10010392_67390 [Streptomyces clavifer]|nr:hypothetical protein GCM10010392_67390 [Streptomyces clavifer]